MSWLDRLVAAVPGSATTARLMGGRLIAYPLSLARLMGHREADVEHLLYGLLGMVDMRNALVAHGIAIDDAEAVLDQLLQEKPTCAENEQPPYPIALAPRFVALAEIAAPKGLANVFDLTSVAVLRATAAALPRELTFLRKAIEAAATDVGPLFDGALTITDGGLSLEAWDPLPAAAVGACAQITKKRPGSIISPATVLFALLCLKRFRETLEARGIDASAIVKEFPASMPRTWWTPRELTEGPNTFSPSLHAVLLRTERYAADDASDVRLRDLLAALHDEPSLAPWVEKIAG